MILEGMRTYVHVGTEFGAVALRSTEATNCKKVDPSMLPCILMAINLTLWLAICDKNISMIDPRNKPVLSVKSSDSSIISL
jgi:hypothetical protein